RREESERLRFEIKRGKWEVLDLGCEIAERSSKVHRENTAADAMTEVPRCGKLLNRRGDFLIQLVDHDKIAAKFPDAPDEAVQLLVFGRGSLGRGPSGSIELIKDHEPILGDRIIEDGRDLKEHLHGVLNVGI